MALLSRLHRASGRFRARRLEKFLRLCNVDPNALILDSGGGPEIWETLAAERRPRVVYVNLPRAVESGSRISNLVFADGRALPFADGAFDIAFSNSVIEHVGSAQDQSRFAEEIRRVGRSYWVQTPNRWFPVEQHLLTPIIHWLPRGLQRFLVPRFTVWRLLARPQRDRAEFYYRHFLEDVRLLSASELAGLFPGAKILRERFLGWTKSLVAYRTEAGGR